MTSFALVSGSPTLGISCAPGNFPSAKPRDCVVEGCQQLALAMGYSPVDGGGG